MDHQYLRVEYRGPATIHDVIMSHDSPSAASSTSSHLEELSKKGLADKALVHCQKSLASLETHLSTLNAQHTDAKDLDKIIDQYELSGEKLDKKVLGLEKRIKSLEEDIKAEHAKITSVPDPDVKLRLRVEVALFAPSEGEVQMVLIYVVGQATWTAAYDIRVDMNTKDKPVTLTYKATTTQSTGEVSLTAPWPSFTISSPFPEFGLAIPTLSVYQRPTMPAQRARALSSSRPTLSVAALLTGDSIVETRQTSVSSNGKICATYCILGIITIASDGVSHNVTIAELELNATMSWVSISRVAAKTHLTARIKNASQYTLLKGVQVSM
ncbi:hypothetical protein Hypma_009752 [Hypsizygus marmoreus]|uniref:DUF4139 domain-containing protein n=1 Tax=Hypsizygus marmoreus TaxID=39966 RepID=A0A369JMP3_HYPMA|nr:hypothetical protein Hypma_009752 [Hypsizygus marmoreus]